ncbi:MAG: glycosyl transferase family 4 [Candidatus Nanoarchaeia archaeon]|nr:glycosyl transferase family 4 [Candidatus Nanoarchaeia archaeon]MDD5358166.1 glycosyl transferase family 4 [Candidatus Nanoarchaeia archaeon]MDD5589353.1 glycosyl transferase family 4 [Candidatus Nanoarchaeia archaeon]
MEIILLIPIFLGFVISLFSIPFWIRKAKKFGLVGKDVNKVDKEDVAEAGGICVVIGFIIGVLSYVAIKTFYFKTNENLIEIFVLLSTILMVCFIGFIDGILGWKIGLNRKTRILFLFFASIPLIVINAGEARMMGIELGLLFPLVIIPLGIIGASATFNFLAGYNGLETGQGIIILSSLSIITFIMGNTWLSIITLCMVSSLISFYVFNKYPAKVFPGDVLTYSVGALIAVIAILGNVEKIAVFFFIPYIIETGLKIRGKLKKESFAKVNEDGSLEMPYGKIYGLEHLAIYILKKIKPNKKVYEREVVYLINGFQILIIVAGFLIFKEGIFANAG